MRSIASRAVLALAASAPEAEMLECTASAWRPQSRLSCQIKLNSNLDGLVLHLPETQQ